MTARRPDLNGRAAQRLRAHLIATRPHVCVVCGKWIDCTLPATHDDGPTREHLIPVSRGGHPTDPANAALSHRRCNTRRGNRPLHTRPDRVTTSQEWT